MAVDSGTLPSPAEFLRRELDILGWTQTDLAFVLDVPVQAVNQIALGKRGISAAMAKALGEIFATSPEYILSLQKSLEIKAELLRAPEPDPSIARKTKLVTDYPVREMIKRGWLTADRETIDTQLLKFFGVTAAEHIPHLAHAAKKTAPNDNVSSAQLAWLYRVRQIAGEVLVPQYRDAALRATLPRLRELMATPEDAGRVPRLLAECGIRFVIVETIPGAKIDGVCFWMDGDTSPVVGMSLRFDRIDNFWFVLRHELEHVLRRDGITATMIDSELDSDTAHFGDELPEEERQANAAASDFCVPRAQMESWIARKAPFFSDNDLLGFAKRLQIHPGIAAGQLRNRLKRHNLFSRFLVKVRFALVTSAVVDGWGEVYPVAQ